ncbi:hypothetical protein NHX12_031516 [Muraenolepis orangiensis]|uniref:Uncharacterized protein n=1 Tax=Muraenolepis orangiensis TaxID=630683 RepID=A0A9Q0IJR3_9TELE|nr:hypothetical protein NHX12_031516 [Muraenolepis orangiensis]
MEGLQDSQTEPSRGRDTRGYRQQYLVRTSFSLSCRSGEKEPARVRTVGGKREDLAKRLYGSMVAVQTLSGLIVNNNHWIIPLFLFSSSPIVKNRLPLPDNPDEYDRISTYGERTSHT